MTAVLPGMRAQWSRRVTVADCAGTPREWHLLDTHSTGATSDAAAWTGERPRLTLLCVHGNPTWSYIFRGLLAAAPPDVRVVAVDQLDMGLSERTDVPRTLANRIDDLDSLTSALGLVDVSPVVTVAHDWGGPISLGWALRHVDALAGVVLTNTAIHQPASSAVPTLIRIARSEPLRRVVTEKTAMFVKGTAALSRMRRGQRMSADVAAALCSPYASAQRRRAVGQFVADIPLEPGHPSMSTLEGIAAALPQLDEVPTLLLWGPDDPVFSDRYLRDLVTRLPHADVQRYEGARHLVLEDAPHAVADLMRWVEGLGSETNHGDAAETSTTHSRASLLDEVRMRADDTSVAIVELHSGISTSWRTLAARIDSCARGLRMRGVQSGDRIAMLVTPGADLIVSIYAAWSIGAVAVVADAGLGVRGMRRALRGAHVDHVIAIPAGLALARTLAIRGLRVRAGASARADRLADTSLAELEALGRADDPSPSGAVIDLDSDALVGFTSGATGPAKGVVYTHSRLLALRDVLRNHYVIERHDALVAAFAPWSVLGPLLGIPSALPDMDLRRASSLTAVALAQATAAVKGTLVWASPAALRGVAATKDQLDSRDLAALASLRLVLAAGAPVPAQLLAEVAQLAPRAQARTPYGMTEALPVTDISLDEILVLPDEDGACVGVPVAGAQVAIAPLDAMGRVAAECDATAGVTGEICVRGAHIKDRYDALWATQSAAMLHGWHRTGDVGHLDQSGRLWVEGRLAHVIVTASGPRTPVGPEQRAEQLGEVRQAACVGVGPAGAAALVMVVVPRRAPRRDGLADSALTAAVRATVNQDVAAVLVARALPVDIRHQSKIDRTSIALWAERVLSGGRIGRLT